VPIPDEFSQNPYNSQQKIHERRWEFSKEQMMCLILRIPSLLSSLNPLNEETDSFQGPEKNAQIECDRIELAAVPANSVLFLRK
ncbi:hypothetical protein PMAYCL1PPCAC_05016, partial [Pristionchus mayeri]